MVGSSGSCTSILPTNVSKVRCVQSNANVSKVRDLVLEACIKAKPSLRMQNIVCKWKYRKYLMFLTQAQSDSMQGQT